MYLYMLSVRAKSPEFAAEFCLRFSQNLPLIQEPGFLHGRCATSVDDPLDVLLVEEWGSLAGVQAWLASPVRERLIQQAMPLTVSPQTWKVKIYFVR